MAMIYVRTKPDRKLFFEGKVIPQDKFIPVPDTPYIRRLIHHWEDLEVQEGGGEERKGRPAERKKDEPLRPVGGKVEPSNPPAPGTGSPAPKV
jgi:hypothetical protein